ncbi:MAG TPA: hypothetical protein VHA78_05555 [Candidatus Peribacteraceae bacterium]|nr:hypothetical protein [Candidatus Peribacteraceae bacterium]
MSLFDSTLLEQIIDTEVDLMISRYCQEKGMTVSDEKAFCWKHQLLHEISEAVIDHEHHRCLTPAEMQSLLRDRTAEWIESQDADARNPTILSIGQPFSLFTRLLVYCKRPGLKRPHP